MGEQPLVVAIDGPAGAGKSAAARLLAEKLGLPYVDTGAMYRAVALLALEAGIALPPDENGKAQLVAFARNLDVRFGGTPANPKVFLGARDVTAALRREEVSRAASLVSAVAEVREELVRRQRALGGRGAVVEGRDIGTVVFPQAKVKFFLTARPEVRAQRRLGELEKQGTETNFAAIVAEIRERDLRDSTRPVSPLRPARDAIVLDTSDLTLDEVVATLLEYTRARIRDVGHVPVAGPQP
ncbi:MAG: (d)CMP kinase [Thermoanaerobaculum sp.]